MTTRTALTASHHISTAVYEEITASVRHALHPDGNDLALRPEDVDELAALACAIFDDVTAVVGGRLPAVSLAGAMWTRPGVDWADSLRAGTTLFEVLQPIAIRELASPRTAATQQVSVVLHQAILTRVVRGSLAEMTSQSGRVIGARRDERRRMARDLHDRVLHGIGLAIQGLDLHRYQTRHAQAPGRSRLDTAIDLLRQVAQTLQQFSVELRRSVEAGGLERALRAYLAAHVEPCVAVAVRTRGNLASLPADVSEEIYLIMREAARNAVRHGGPSRLEIDIEVSDRTLRATLTDDGQGFVPVAAPLTGGLSSMRERATALNGRLTASSAPGAGTRVEVRIPLVGAGL
ncbi:sensor histidine kinase [Streptomyces sp. SM14]|uniref:sensor histidine kinase n=1 Tax=Streptomyces sp. SM14 TaxID=1736045 RepID=UPI0015E19B3A|nr:ATP-binding protein [Streptomyces sp. SM14]